MSWHDATSNITKNITQESPTLGSKHTNVGNGGSGFFFQQMWTRKEESRTRAVFRGHLCALCYSSYIFLNTLHLLPRLHHPTICCPCPTCMRSVVNLDRNLFLSFYFWQSKQPQVRLASPLKCHIMPKKKKKTTPEIHSEQHFWHELLNIYLWKSQVELFVEIVVNRV